MDAETVFEWDDAKAAGNAAKHDVRFEVAVEAFFDPRKVEFADTRRDYREPRFLVIGAVEGIVLVVCYTPREAAIRLISARPASRKERRLYADHEIPAPE